SAGEEVAIPAEAIREVLRPGAVTRVPHAPPSLLGLMNLRGVVVPVVSLARLLGREGVASTSAARVVVVGAEAPIGLLVESVSAVGPDSGGRCVDPDALLSRGFGNPARRTPGPAVRRG